MAEALRLPRQPKLLGDGYHRLDHKRDMLIEIELHLFHPQINIFTSHAAGKCFIFELLFDGFHRHIRQTLRGTYEGDSRQESHQLIDR